METLEKQIEGAQAEVWRIQSEIEKYAGGDRAPSPPARLLREEREAEERLRELRRLNGEKNLEMIGKAVRETERRHNGHTLAGLERGATVLAAAEALEKHAAEQRRNAPDAATAFGRLEALCAAGPIGLRAAWNEFVAARAAATPLGDPYPISSEDLCETFGVLGFIFQPDEFDGDNHQSPIDALFAFVQWYEECARVETWWSVLDALDEPSGGRSDSPDDLRAVVVARIAKLRAAEQREINALGAVLLPGVTVPTPSPTALRAEASVYERAGDFDGAAALLDRAAALEPPAQARREHVLALAALQRQVRHVERSMGNLLTLAAALGDLFKMTRGEATEGAALTFDAARSWAKRLIGNGSIGVRALEVFVEEALIAASRGDYPRAARSASRYAAPMAKLENERTAESGVKIEDGKVTQWSAVPDDQITPGTEPDPGAKAQPWTWEGAALGRSCRVEVSSDHTVRAWLDGQPATIAQERAILAAAIVALSRPEAAK